MDYLDFDIEIGKGSSRAYPVTVVRSAAGEAHETMQFPFNELELENQLLRLQIVLRSSDSKRRQILSPDEQSVQKFGQALFEALFTGKVRTRYAQSKSEAFHQGKGLRLKLRIQSSELAALPWEFLYDPEQADYLCLSNNTPLVRYLELPQPPRPLPVHLPLRILGMIASPQDKVGLDIEGEKARVEKALKPLEARGLVELRWLSGQADEDLQRAMRTGPWHVFHFIGHGGFDPQSDEGLIALVDEQGRTRLLTATRLGRLLADHSSLRLVVLNSCEGARGSEKDIFSSTASILVRRGIPAVLAMQYEITDSAAIEISRAFYESLAENLPVDMAVSEARKHVSMVNTMEWGTPVLYMRSPDGVLFDLPNIKHSQRDQQTIKMPSPSDPLSATLLAFPQVSMPLKETGTKVTLKDFFISYNSADKPWAEWIAWQLEEAGYSVVFQAWDFRPGSNFVLEMDRATKEAQRTIAVLSPHYLDARYPQPEWAEAFGRDPKGEEGTLLPVRVRECEIKGLLGPIVYIDLCGLDEPRAREALLSGIGRGRKKPKTAPTFPQIARRTLRERPPYPGNSFSDTPTCKRCGREVPADARFCPQCGFSFLDQLANQVHAQTIQFPADEPPDMLRSAYQIPPPPPTNTQTGVYTYENSFGSSAQTSSNTDYSTSTNSSFSSPESSATYCVRCGASLAPGMAICPSCGTLTSSTISNPEISPYQPTITAPPPYQADPYATSNPYGDLASGNSYAGTYRYPQPWYGPQVPGNSYVEQPLYGSITSVGYQISAEWLPYASQTTVGRVIWMNGQIEGVEMIGKDVKEAEQRALTYLGRSANDVTVTVLRKSFFGKLGMGKKGARVRVIINKTASSSGGYYAPPNPYEPRQY